MKDITLDSKLKALGNAGLAQPQKKSPLSKPGEGPSFNDVLKKAIAEVNGLEKEADRQIVELAAGKAGNIHEAMIALQKADISFKTLMEIRDKLIQAYQEIMRLSV
ncbi:MAG: flagellar hook-basal body complex protein FliE [Candidatus Lernaella stagnicola]|nr:flagellar hook-basal body complex protein FliE [Candidatus Lernaella stagnicola]